MMTSRSVRLGSLTLALLLATDATAHAQQTRDTIAMNQLVVSVTRVPIARAAASAAVSVITGDELRARGVHSVADALRLVAGTAISEPGSYGAFGSLFMRGGQSDYVQVLVDGVRVNSPGEHFDFGNFTIEDIERIEVVRGPVSVLYGSDAVSGIVQLFTRRGAGSTHVDVAASGGLGSKVGPAANGSFGSGNLDAQLRGGRGNFSYSAGLSQFASEGAYAFNNQNRNTGLTTRFDLRPDTRTSAGLTLRYSNNLFHYPTDGAGNLVDDNQRDNTTGLAAGLDLARTLSQKFDVRALLSVDRNDDAYSDAPDNSADTLGFYAYFSKERFQHEAADVRVNYTVAPHVIFTAGGEYDRQHERGSNQSQSQYGPDSGASAAQRHNLAAYGQLLGVAGILNYQVGVRHDNNNRFGDFTTWRAGVSAVVAPHVRVRASAGTSFKQPRFYEQFATGFVKGNPDLAPERSRSIDGGMEFDKQLWHASATYFTQHFRDLIQYVGAPASPNDPNYLNLGGASANGLELEAEHRFSALSLRANYTLLHTRVTDAGVGDDPLFVQGSRLVRRPKHSGAVSLAYTRPSWSATATASYVGKRDDLDYTNYPSARVVLAPYTRIDVSAERALTRNDFRATVKIENLADASYQDAYNFPSRGRVIFLGVRYAN